MPGIAITGAHGFVGSMLARRFEDAGWTVTPFSHSAGASDGETQQFRLGDEVRPEIFRSRNITALVHCAYDFRPVARAEKLSSTRPAVKAGMIRATRACTRRFSKPLNIQT